MLGHRPPEDHRATVHDGLMETFTVGESCCERISTLQSRVDLLQQDVDDISSQLDQKASLVLVMALENDLQQKANVQNVSRMQQDLFELSVHLDEKADTVDVTALRSDLDEKADTVDVTSLRSDLAQKASAQSVTQLQSQVDMVQDAVRQKASLLNLSRLEGVVRGKASVGDVANKANETALESVRAQLVAAEAELRQKADASSTPRFADLPVTPNMMQDTKHFHGVCHGRVGVETPWADAWGPPWEFFNYLGTAVDAASSTVEVVDMTSQASVDRAGLWPLGALSASEGGLLRDDFYGADVRALLLTVRTLPAAAQGAVGWIKQGCDEYTSWSVGSFTTEVGVFVNVLEHTGNIWMNFAGSFGAGVLITGPATQGWQHLHNTRAGWGGCEQSEIVGEGRMRVAIALPYQSFGNHSNVPVWSGFDPNFFRGDV